MDSKQLETLRLRVVAAGALADDAADAADQAEAEHDAASLRYRKALDKMAKIRAQRKVAISEQPTTDHDRSTREAATKPARGGRASE